jgi:hypothetical protein
MGHGILMASQKVPKALFLSFRRKSLDRLGTLSLSNGPESRFFEHLQNVWTPVFTGVTTFYESINTDR